MSKRIVPVILSGGTGSRLWPVSRRTYPKQFWPLLGEKTLIQQTALRAAHLGLAQPVVICNAEHRFIVAEQLKAVGITQARIVLEPVGRNSAPALAAAALLVAETDPQAVLWIMAADAAIPDEEALGKALGDAVRAAEDGFVVTFGMTPDRAETGYGYIEYGAPLPGLANVYELTRFVEKPDAEQAAELVRKGGYLWNSGMFIAQARIFLEEIRCHAPEIYAHVRNAVANRVSDLDFERLDEESFIQSPCISIDYALAERTKRAAVVPGTFTWSDIGSWDALWELGEKDPQGNVVFGDVKTEQAANCYIRSDGSLTAVLGVENLMVIVTRDAVLVAHRDRAQEIGPIVARLAEDGYSQAHRHNRLHRPWGFYESLICGERFQVKRIVVAPRQKLSLQKHFHRSEHWVVVGGTALVTRDGEQVLVRENESIYLPLGAVHRLENPGQLPLTLIEVQSGAYLGEDDIVRLEDSYARETPCERETF